ncbi:2,3-diaminopropionate biosynthesis protein SbnB [Streptomyces nitrosporeus]|uniref:2,3-diaminopropionate biosynthesis protein SbnB n=1 Tax=Streptomyces nitrosporeus TaxID=28894 RepID=A0A5J6FFZ5_9ACTN|nr:2,3-diaminopropionate biosynthesis protein SbnB [Streptomyces nitrosporeus]QEU73890.1 2,3-diaminopropionate biosynthesis protein SbnB [Streptomyces nitrosporeus]GGZ25813.1 2,3-diaminopropionate biosynthesis protein SbnB [Streptomyces nitrosporeus]
MLILKHGEVAGLLAGREKEVIDLVAAAYQRHDEGRTVLPHSVFLRFPDRPRDRIIGLPGYLGEASHEGTGAAPAPGHRGEEASGAGEVAGMKWISSFPGNVAAGLERASAAVLLNSLDNGHPEALIEGSLISARRTAASAALGARVLLGGRRPTGLTLIGTGVINREVLRFLAAELPGLDSLAVHDTDMARAKRFTADHARLLPGARIRHCATLDEALGAHDLVSFATTAATPHTGLDACPPGTAVLHISLRDLTVPAVLGAHNVVDDTDHVCREQTSLHLAEQHTGGRDFVHAPIGALLRGTARPVPRDGKPLVYSPFGLGVLDLALAAFVRDEARRGGIGTRIDGFLPGPTL